ncbi:MAG: M12 family metallopeptidase, partial [bacterium]
MTAQTGKYWIEQGHMIRGIIFTAMLMLMDASPSLGGVGIPLSSPHLFWTENKVPYVITTAHNPAIIFSAIKEFQSKTNIRFVPRSDEKDFLELAGAPENEHPCSWGGSTSRWGKRPGRQILSLGPGCKLGNYIHELAHVLGMYHEQQHPDRDRFILVSFNNIISGFKAYFEINPSWIPAPGQAHSPFDF